MSPESWAHVLEVVIHKAVEAGLNPGDPAVLLETMRINWELITDNVACEACHDEQHLAELAAQRDELAAQLAAVEAELEGG